MKNLKSEVLNICKRYCKVNELDISESELASLSIYSMLQKGYFKDSYNFIRLYKNEYNEFVMGYKGLSNIQGVTNSTVSGAIIRIDKKDNEMSIATPDKEDLLLKEKEVLYLNSFIEIMEKNKSFNDFIKDLNKLNNRSLENKYIYKSLYNILDNDSYGEEISLKSILDFFVEPLLNEEELENFNSSCKTNLMNFIGSDEKNLSYIYGNVLEKLTGIKNYKDIRKLYISGKSNEDLIKYCIDNNIIDKDIDYIRKNTFIYDKSILKVIDNNMIDNLEYYINDKRFESIKKYNKIKIEEFLINENESEIFFKYKKDIDIIEKNIYKKYPLLKESYISLTSVPSDIEKSSPKNTTEILNDTVFLDLNYNDETNFSIINGLTTISYMNKRSEYRESDYKLKLNNGLENTAIFDIVINNDLDRYKSGAFNNLKVLNIFNLCFLNRKDINLKDIKNGIQNIVNSTDKNTIIAFEFTDANGYSKYNVKVFNNLMKDIINENKDRLFCSKGITTEIFPYELRNLKVHTAVQLDKEKISYNETVKIFNYFDTLKKEEIDSLSKLLETDQNEYHLKINLVINKNKSKKLKV